MHSTYLVKNRTTNYVYETPQYAFVMIGVVLFNTLKEIKDFYRELTAKWLNIPTPIMAGVRTGTRQFASCCLIDIDDDLDSIYASNHAIGRFVSRRAGIGVNMGRIRSFGSEIRKGEASHTGIIPFLKLVEAATKSCSQGGLRDGCLKKDTLVKVVDKVKIDGVEYNMYDTILVNGENVVVSNLV
jgi:ribonucleoside-diphosphate reductase alpha chain